MWSIWRGFQPKAALSEEERATGLRMMTWQAVAGSGADGLASGGFLAAFPPADHLWLNALEGAFPAVRNTFLRPRERQDFEYALRDIARFSQEIGHLQARREAARWGDAPLSEEMLRRIDLTMASHQENIAGERAVVRILRARVRARQRYILGLPLLAAGAALACACGAHLRPRRGATIGTPSPTAIAPLPTDP